jgi:hypothetical protein
MQRFPFLAVFNENSDGSLTPKRQIHINGINFGPGTIFNKGVAFGGVDFHLYKYWDIAGEEKDGVLVILGFYQQ